MCIRDRSLPLLQIVTYILLFTETFCLLLGTFGTVLRIDRQCQSEVLNQLQGENKIIWMLPCHCATMLLNSLVWMPVIPTNRHRIMLVQSAEFFMCLHQTVDPPLPGTHWHGPNNVEGRLHVLRASWGESTLGLLETCRQSLLALLVTEARPVYHWS